MAVLENDYAAYIQTADGEVPIKDLSVPQTVLEKSIENYYALRRTGKVYQTKIWKFATNPTSTGEKLLDNAGLVFEPSTDAEEVRNVKGKRILKFVVDGQTIKKTGDFDNIVTGSKGYLFAQFILSPEWHGCKIAASFFSGGKEYPAILDENGVCEIPEQALAKRHFAVSITGISNNYRIVTHKVFVKQGD